MDNASLGRLLERARRILVWHQGALGDVLLAGPALLALARRYPGAGFTLVGNPATLGLLAATLPVAAVLSSSGAVWLELFQEAGAGSPALGEILAPLDLAVIFGPQEQPDFLERWRRAGVPRVCWLPSFPLAGRRPLASLQAARLQALGLETPPPEFRLVVPPGERQAARVWREVRGQSPGPLVALAPGSGHPRKNWPLANYLELGRWLTDAWQAEVWWVLGPAETALGEQVVALHPPARGRLLQKLPLSLLAAYLAECALFVGNDSGVTHLAAAVGVPRVTAIFGPSDPVIWSPPGATVIAGGRPCAPCTQGRTITCPEAACLTDLAMAVVRGVLEEQLAAAGF